LVGSLMLLLAGWAGAYPSAVHQELTFLAARQLNHCLDALGEPPLTALEVRYVARANAKMADRSTFARMFRWNYYGAPGTSGDVLWGLFDTRFADHFDELEEALASQQSEVRRLKTIGRLVFYLQRVTTPQRVVPVFSNRFWRLSLADRFDQYPVDEARVGALTTNLCGQVFGASMPVHDLLDAIAQGTREAVQEPIPGLPVTWEVFWQAAKTPGAFGDYGAAGNNFGREVEFDCPENQTCVLLDNDPLYAEFAAHRHVDAVLATMHMLARLRGHDAAPEEDSAEEEVREDVGEEVCEEAWEEGVEEGVEAAVLVLDPPLAAAQSLAHPI